MKINGHVHIDLTDLGDDAPGYHGHKVDRAVQEATFAPAGADVFFAISRGQMPSFIGLEYLREHGQHIGSVTFECDHPDTIRHWCDVLRRHPLEGIA